MKTRVALWAALAVVICAFPAVASAQSFGIGPRFSFVRGNLTTGTPSTRLVGGTMRIVTGGHTALEGSFDYRAFMNEAKTERTRETPMQGSLLLFLVRSTLSPYVAGGLGVYTQMHDTLGPAGVVLTTTSERRVGWHLGAGAEIKFHRHAAFFLDYRFRFVRFGEPAEGAEPIKIPGQTIVPVLEKVKLSHEGSMWTSGMAFYF
jgi:opacity protein-like surface antigen